MSVGSDGPGHGAGMIDITDKPPVRRIAAASGMIKLKESTIEAIRNNRIIKGDALTTSRIAAILAVKDTPRQIPMCHQIPITSIDVDFSFEPGSPGLGIIRAKVTVTSVGKTGVEMEALAGVSSALLNIWDMVKYLEKDETGNYPDTEISDIRVLEKMKEAVQSNCDGAPPQQSARHSIK